MKILVFSYLGRQMKKKEQEESSLVRIVNLSELDFNEGKFLKYLREQASLSQGELAEVLTGLSAREITQSCISRIERGTTSCDLSLLKAYSIACDFTIEASIKIKEISFK